MKHKELKNKLVFFVEETLPQEEMDRIGEHLEDCQECRMLYQQLRTDFSFLKEDGVFHANPYFYTKVKAKLAAPVKENEFIFHRLLQPALFVCLLVLSIGVGMKVGNWFGNASHVEAKADFDPLYFDEINNEPIEAFLLKFE